LRALGVQRLDEGDAEGACIFFRQAADLEPTAAVHQINLAYGLQAAGAPELAVLHLQQAVGLEPRSFDAHYMLAGALEKDGELPAAIKHLQHAIRLKPEYSQAIADLGRVQAAAGEHETAYATLAAGLDKAPDHYPLQLYTGNACLKLSRPEEAITHYRLAITLEPDAAEAHANLGRAHHAMHDFESALVSLRRSLELKPETGATHLQLAMTFNAMGRLDEAAAAAARASELLPADPEALNFLGMVWAEQGRLDEAIAMHRRAIQIRPDLPGAYGNLGLALFQRGDVAGAALAYEQGLALESVAEIHDNLGNALLKLGRVDEAITNYRRALELQPKNLNTRCNLAAALAEGGGPRQAIAAYREILALKPDHVIAHFNLLFNLSVDPDCSTEKYLAEAKSLDVKLNKQALSHGNASRLKSNPRVRVGLVSADLRSHPVGYFIEGILHSLGDARIELFGYPTLLEEDSLTERIRPRFRGWRQLAGLTDEVAAREILSDEIDILIDLAGYTAGNRLGVFAWRPAPLQVSWLGYFASTGLQFIDYVLADPLCVPVGNEWQFTEKVWRLPHTRLCFTPPPPDTTPAVSSLPAFRNGYVTFGCFQRLAKLTDEVLALWARVLEAVPGSRLRLQSIQTGRPIYVNQITEQMSKAGIPSDRLLVVGPTARPDYWNSYAEVDIVLDTFPYTGGTTTCEALWMGVPTLTLTGETMIARQGVAMLTNAGLPEWVANGPEDYVSKAQAFSSDLQSLARLRSSLRSRLPETPLFNSRSFAADLECALIDMWKQHLADVAAH